ncbi:DUF438 domain-containing protein [Veillonella seminalis]|uniref:DUF438 domain-containing protein n=1 Tax=Veillonella seminalis TaxID=1502943 RepID=UPI0023F11064|nr:DUF438 domain-containing protein [Veillonella seminalis]
MTTMKTALGLNNNTRLEKMIEIKDGYLSRQLSLKEARALLKDHIGTCTPDEFAYGEQQLKGSYTDEEIPHRMDELLELFDDILIRAENTYPENHPLWVYMEEIKAGLAVIDEVDALLKAPHFIKNPWLGIYDKLAQWSRHLSRKQNQLYPALEKYGFDRPTQIMWTFDDKVRGLIRESRRLLEAGKQAEFLALQPIMADAFRDLADKEQEVLLPTAYKLVSDNEFSHMSRGDHEIGFALITPTPFYGNATTNTNGINSTKTDLNSPASEQNFMSELAALLGKYNVATAPSAETELDVATGKLSLERINLLFKHMPVDLSYVDENELVKFYSDTKHRIFPRSANVIGREVRNCHPAKSVHLVEEIIEKFRSGEQDKAEFWINKPEAFIYILYTAVRDEQGNFKGVLEMMQDCTRIRSLEGSRTLLTWDDEVHGNASISAADATGETEAVATVQETATEKKATTAANNDTITVKGITITGDTKLFDLFDQVPGLRQHMPKINSNFAMLNTAFGKIMAKKATIAKASDRSGMNQADLIKAIAQYIEANL